MSRTRGVIPVGSELPSMDSGEPASRMERRPTENASPKPKRAPGRGGGAVRRRFTLLNEFLDRAMPKCRRSEIAAWMLLYRHAKADGTVTASVADLARRAGCCESAMRRALKSLHKRRFLERLKRGTLAGGPSVWRLLTPDGDQP